MKLLIRDYLRLNLEKPYTDLFDETFRFSYQTLLGLYFFFFFRCPLDGKTMNFERGSNKVHLLCLFHLSYLMP